MAWALGSAILALILTAAFAYRGVVVLALGCVLAFVIAGVAAWSAQRERSGRQIAEIALRDSDEKYRMLLNDVQDYSIFMLDPLGAVVSWNAGAERIKSRRNYRSELFPLFPGGRHRARTTRRSVAPRGSPRTT